MLRSVVSVKFAPAFMMLTICRVTSGRTSSFTRIRIPGRMKPGPWRVAAFPTIRKPSKNSAVAEKESPRTRRKLERKTGSPLRKICPPTTPSTVISSTGLRKIDSIIFITTRSFPLSNLRPVSGSCEHGGIDERRVS